MNTPAKTNILVVEDEPHLAILIKFNLEQENYHVTTVGDGPAALKHLESEPVDLMILDLMLPGMSGYAVCETLREAGNAMPILMLSARTLAEDRSRGFDVGANQYMLKPFELDELFSRVKNLLRISPRSRPEPDTSGFTIGRYEFAQAEINFRSYEVKVAGEPVKMTPLELKLLHYFVANEGRVIPRHEILEAVWEMPGHVQTRAPDQFMRRLRVIFENDPAEPQHFLTIRDAGYRFVAEA